jgi:hypothetical protein
MQGDFLSSEDVELLEALAGYIGIAIQNGRLYASSNKKSASTSGSRTSTKTLWSPSTSA